MSEKVKFSIDRLDTIQEIPGSTMIIFLPSGKEIVLRFLKSEDAIEINKSEAGSDGESAITIKSNYPNEIIIK